MVNGIDPDGYFHQVKKKKKKGGLFGKIFGIVLGFALGGPLGASLAALNAFVPEVQTAFRVLQIIGGIGMVLSGNPAGAFFIASGAMSFGKGRGWQIGSQFMGLAGSAILLSQSFNSPALAEGQGGNAGQSGQTTASSDPADGLKFAANTTQSGETVSDACTVCGEGKPTNTQSKNESWANGLLRAFGAAAAGEMIHTGEVLIMGGRRAAALAER